MPSADGQWWPKHVKALFYIKPGALDGPRYSFNLIKFYCHAYEVDGGQIRPK
jgi:hypothetical protein